jgi:hypothetical protein
MQKTGSVYAGAWRRWERNVGAKRIVGATDEAGKAMSTQRALQVQHELLLVRKYEEASVQEHCITGDAISTQSAPYVRMTRMGTRCRPKRTAGAVEVAVGANGK